MTEIVKKKKPQSKAADKQQQPDKSRRRMLTHGGIAAGGLAAFAAGYGEVAWDAGKGLVTGSSGEIPRSRLYGNALTPEFKVDEATGELTPAAGQTVAMSTCMGCWSLCGVRVRVDDETQRILRVAGNPFHPLATTRPLPMETSMRDAYLSLARGPGIEGRATSCGRGSAMFELQTSPHRVLQPLKRVGPRGSGQWQTISFEQLIKEVCDGGDLFGEGHVDGLRALYEERHEPIDRENPDYGPRANQFVFTDASNEGRTGLIRRFTEQSFGSINFANHGAYCGQAYRVGAGAALGNVWGMPHSKPDWSNTRFGLFIGTAPAQAGNPFQRQGRQMAEARTEPDGEFRYVVITPVLPASTNLAAGSGNRWLPIKPATDLALVLGMIQWIIANERYDAHNLSQPGPAAMRAAGEASWSNATHLLVSDPEHPHYGQFLRGKDLGWEPEFDDDGEEVEVFVVQRADGSLAPHTEARPAAVQAERTLQVPAWGDAGRDVAVATSLVMLQRAANEKTLAEYSALCGISEAEIVRLARELTSHGKRAAVNSHGGMMHGAGFQTAYAVGMLNTLIGNLNVRGGIVIDAGPFGPFGPGPRYNFAQFEGRAQPEGLRLGRNRARYEDSEEYKRKVKAGENPYPARAPWYPMVGNGLSSEVIASALNGYPYHAKVWFNHMANPIYGIAGFRAALEDKIKDSQLIPLIVAIDPFINETTALADYVVPDTISYESWGIGAPWSDVVAKTSTVRIPAVEPRVAKNAAGESINLETFLLSCANTLGMPGFGAGAIKDRNGQARDLNTISDWYLPAIANIAYAGGKPVGEASDDDLELTGGTRWRPLLEEKLGADEWRRVAMILTRGGRFDRPAQAWQGEHTVASHAPALSLWNEKLSATRNSLSGERANGCPIWQEPQLANGTPMREKYSEDEWPLLVISYKSNLMSSISIGASRLRQVHPNNPISLHYDDARRFGIANGQRIRVTSPNGSITGVAILRKGIMPGVVAVEFGYGHKGLGASAVNIDGKEQPATQGLAAGVNMNDIGIVDDTRGGHVNCWVDSLSGASVRQALPVRVKVV